MTFEIHSVLSVYKNQYNPTLLGQVDQDRNVYGRVGGSRDSASQIYFKGHYEDNGRVYKDNTKQDDSLVGYVDQAGQLFNPSGVRLGSISSKGSILDDKGIEIARVRQRVGEQQETVTPDALTKIAAAAALLVVIRR
jgi:hypothetical protein